MGAIDGQNRQLSGPDIAQKTPIGNQYAFAFIASADGTTKKTLLTGSPGYFLTNLALQVDPTCTIASAGMVDLLLTDTVFGIVAGARWFIPAVAAGMTIPTNNLIQTGGGFAWNNTTANSSLQINISVALTAGQIRFSCRFANVTFLG